MMFLKCISVVLQVLLLSECTLTPKSRKSTKPEKTDAVKLGADEYSVFDKNLVINPPTAKDILYNHKAYYLKTDQKRIKGMVLGYVTPWNNNGYNAAFIFANKFTHISPVWLQAKRVQREQYEVLGTHDVDADWMSDVRKAGKNNKLKMVPRVIFDNWSAEDYTTLAADEYEWSALCRELVATAKRYKFDGYVVELWSQVVGRLHGTILLNLVQEIAIQLRKSNLEIILVIPPMRSKTPLFDKIHFDALYDYVDGFSLMTYDFSSVHRPGPNAPIMWIEDCVKLLAPGAERREKILTGFNFYGYDYTPAGGGAIVSHDYLKLLKKYKGKLQIDEKSQEHYFEVKEADGKHIVFYPTLYSINERIKLVNKLGTGASFWELGQPVDYFFDLL